MEADPRNQTETQEQPVVPASEPREHRSARLRRHGRRARLYIWAFALVALLVIVIALAIANTRQVRLSWIVGTDHASLVWIILVVAVLGWLLGIATAVVFRYRTRRRHPPEQGARTSR